jgi:DNA-binding CsgD family transcriptional regulator/PAS domain-containing protein
MTAMPEVDALLIDRIYECAFAPDLWPGLLGELCNIATARAGFLFVSNGRIHDWATSTQIAADVMRPFVESGQLAGSQRMRRLLAARHAGFLRDLDVFSKAEMLDDPFYRDLLYPRGLGWAAATAIPLPTGDSFAITVEREYRLGPVEASAVQALDALRPHLARAALLSARLQLDRARIASNTLAALGLAALVLDEHGKVLAANPLIEAMADFVVWRAHGGVSLNDRNAEKLLREAIATMDAPLAPSPRSFPVRKADSNATMVAHVIPIRLSARDIFARSAAALVLTPVTLPHALPVELVQSLFDLTPAEARVARKLASGLAVDDIATAAGVSPNTTRTHVRGVLEKTGCSRQSEVVALLNGIWSPRRSE